MNSSNKNNNNNNIINISTNNSSSYYLKYVNKLYSPRIGNAYQVNIDDNIVITTTNHNSNDNSLDGIPVYLSSKALLCNLNNEYNLYSSELVNNKGNLSLDNYLTFVYNLFSKDPNDYDEGNYNSIQFL
jgi:hypothetical protein